MLNILITGANSFVGTNFIKYSKFKDIDEVSLINVDFNKIDFSKYDIVLHVAAIVHQSKKITYKEYIRVNCDLALQVAKKAKKSRVDQFIFLSTIKVYGQFKTRYETWNETSKCRPNDGYGKSKYKAELALKEKETSNFIVSIIRTPLVYGDGVKANMLSIIKLIDKFKFLPLNRIHNQRHFTYIENLIGFIDQIIEKRASGVVLVMDKYPLSTTELTYIISRALNKKVILFKVPDIIIETGKKLIPKIFDRLYGSFKLDNTQTLKKLDYEPKFSTEDGIIRMVESYKRNKLNIYEENS